MDIQSIAFEAFQSGVYKKNIYYGFSLDADPEEFQRLKLLGGSPGQSAWMIQQAYRKVGIQMQVTKPVSRDLMATDFGGEAKVGNVPWPAPVVEFYFEDPLLPTVLLMKTHPADFQKWFPAFDTSRLKSTEYLTALMQEGEEAGGRWLSLQLTPDMYEGFLLSGEVVSMDTGIFSEGLNEVDNCTIAFMVNMCLKVLAFASIPEYKPLAIGRKQMHFGGKPDVKGRPARPSFLTQYQYAPRIEKPRGEPTGQTRAFRGKRGHIHWYRSERFVNRRGTWDYIAPVPDPFTGKYPERKIVRVRKPQ